MTPAFHRLDGQLHVEGVPLEQIAESVGTPAYVYSATALCDAYDELDRALGDGPHTICYSIKANANLAVVAVLVARGAGVDVTSAGELFRALRAGATADRIVYSGVGKREDEIAAALDARIRMFNVESLAELRAIDAVAAARGGTAPISFRVNPDVDPKTHPYISTGLRGSKFGIPIQAAIDAYAYARTLQHVKVVGVDCHIGSQIVDLEPFADALARVRALVLELRDLGHEIEIVDVGGGLRSNTPRNLRPDPGEYGAAVGAAVGDLGCEIIVEPGRSITAHAGLLLTRVLYEKSNEDKRFTIIDAAMNDLLRPALYRAYQRIEPVGPARPGSRKVDVVGPVCESGDFIAQDRSLPPLEEGDLLAIRSAGAYGFVMASNYNARPRAAEVLVRGPRFAVVRERESLEDLVRGERIPEELLQGVG